MYPAFRTLCLRGRTYRPLYFCVASVQPDYTCKNTEVPRHKLLYEIL